MIKKEMMMTNIKLDKELGIVEQTVKQLPEIVETTPIVQRDMGDENVKTSADDIEADYVYQRETFYTLVEKGSTAIDGILELAKEGEHPRGYEVAGNLIKQVAEVTEKLGDLQDKMKKLKEVPDNAPKNVTNALFVGSTAELQKIIKGK